MFSTLKQQFLFPLFLFLTVFCFSETAFENSLQVVDHYKTLKGHHLRYACYIPENPTSKHVVFLEGRGTFLESYRNLVARFLERGYQVWIYDLSGQGGSDRLISGDKYDERTIQCMQHIEDFSYYEEDLQEFIDYVVKPSETETYLLAGYSTGAHVGLRYLQNHENSPFSAAFFISPLLCLKTQIPNAFLKHLFRFLMLFYNSDSYQGHTHDDRIFTMDFNGNPYTNSEEGFEEMRSLCTCHRPFVMGGVSWGWASAASCSIDKLWKKENLTAIKIPVFIATGEEDGVVRVDWNEAFTNSISLGTHVVYPGGKHELFRETPEIREALWSDFDAFMEKCGALP